MIRRPSAFRTGSTTVVFGGTTSGIGTLVPPMDRLRICVDPLGAAVHDVVDVAVIASAWIVICATAPSASTLAVRDWAVAVGADAVVALSFRMSTSAVAGVPTLSAVALCVPPDGYEELTGASGPRLTGRLPARALRSTRRPYES